jgi:hypothetical protein
MCRLDDNTCAVQSVYTLMLLLLLIATSMAYSELGRARYSSMPLQS